MSRIKLETYSVKIRTSIPDTSNPNSKRKKRIPQYEVLDSFGEKQSILKFIIGFLDSIQNLTVDKGQQRTLQTLNGGLSYMDIQEGYYSGVLESGTFGTASTGKNIETGEVSYQKSVKDADLMPHYYMFYLPPRKKFGILVMQRFGNHGISSVFRSRLKNIFSETFKGYYLEINDLIPTEVIKQYLDNGEITEIILRNNSLPKEVEDYLKTRNLILREASVHLKVKKNVFLNDDLINWVDNRRNVFIDIPEIRDFGFEKHSMSVKVKVGKNPREIDFSDTMKMRPYFDIHDEVEKDISTNYPLFSSINRCAIELINSIMDVENEINDAI